MKSYGGAWLYNEIIGYIRLHFLETQVRGEYYAIRRQRIVKTRRKTLEFRTWKLAPEREIPNSASTEIIYSIVLEYIHACRTELERAICRRQRPGENWPLCRLESSLRGPMTGGTGHCPGSGGLDPDA